MNFHGLSTFKLISLLYKQLDFNSRRGFFTVLILSLISSLLETSTILFLAPFLASLVSPTSINDSFYGKVVSSFFKINEYTTLVYLLGFFVIFAAILTAIFRIIYLYKERKLAAIVGNKLSLRSYNLSIRQPYQLQISSKSTEIITKLTYVNILIGGVLQPILAIISSTLLSTAILLTLFSLYPLVTFSLVFFFFITYILLILAFRKRINRISKLNDIYTKDLLKHQTESFGSIKDIIIRGLYDIYTSIYNKIDKPLRLLNVQISLLSTAPRYCIEGSAISLIALCALLFFRFNRTSEIFVVLGVVALGFQRLLPTIQQFYGSIVTLRSNRHVLIGILELLNQPNFDLPFDSAHTLNLQDKNPIKNVSLSSVTFSYDNSVNVLHSLSLSIEQGQSIGIVGPTGGGKSTALNILLGLLKPTEGNVLLDGESLSNPKTLRRWYDNIAHVPQTIYLSDTSISKNIAIGIPDHLIDENLVRSVADEVQLHAFIDSLHDGYNTLVGENGIRLSGGQRQRLGIARALYLRPSYLILDEATSSLDPITEKAIVDRLRNNRNITLISIAHRISTIKNCDVIYLISNGRLLSYGNFDFLKRNSVDFNQLIQSTEFKI